MSQNESAGEIRDSASNPEVFPTPVVLRTTGPQWTSAEPASNELGEGGDMSRYFHALRRRWLVAVVVALPLAALTANAAWKLQPQVYTATAVLRLASAQDALIFEMGDNKANNANTFDLYKRTQRQWMRSRFVLMRALRDSSDLAELAVLRQHPDPADWLETNLSVTFPDESEVMHVSLSGESPEGLAQLVNAVVKAYFDDIVNEEYEKRRERLNGLEVAYRKADQELRAKRNEFRSLVDRVGTGDPTALTLVQQNSLNLFAQFQQRYATVRFDLMRAEGELEAAENAPERAPDAEIPISETDLKVAMKSDAQAAKITAQRQNAVEHREKTTKSFNNEKTRAATVALDEHDRKLKDFDEKLAAREAEVRQELVEKKRQSAEAAIESMKSHIQVLTAQEAQLKKKSGELEAETKQFGKSSIDVEMMRYEISAVADVVTRLATELERTRVEMQSDTTNSGRARVSLKAEAAPARLVVAKARMTKSIGAGVVSLFLPIALIVWLEVRKRRINSKTDVEQQLGLSVIGSVPLIPKRVMRNLGESSSHQLHWQTLLSESVDSIAAILLRGVQSSSTRMIMVSSANSGEGKTTLAAHLATSLAGAGCRTVLVDFDLRRPALHRALELSLQPGVTELLRDKRDFESAVQATQIPNLMFIAAGRSSASGLARLAATDLKCFFDRLRTEFDIVVVDGSPILPVVDTRLIAQHVDAVVLSVLRDVSCTPQLRAACQLLELFNVPILGVVVTGSKGDVYYARYDSQSEVKVV